MFCGINLEIRVFHMDNKLLYVACSRDGQHICLYTRQKIKLRMPWYH